MSSSTTTRGWKTDDFDYHLPTDRIAQFPLEKRDKSRLLVIGNDSFEHRRFYQLPTLLPPKTLLILNDTKVIPARILGKKTATGGRVEIFLLHRESKYLWTALAKGKLRRGTCLDLADGSLPALVEDVLGEGKVLVRFSETADMEKRLEQGGSTPLPPYIHREKPIEEDTERYQTVFAKAKGAMAAPTAGLHFTKTLLEHMISAGYEVASLTLHVGLGTFAPVRCKKLSTHKMEPEFYSIPQKTVAAIHRAKNDGRYILAVGSTVMRALEGASRDPEGKLIPGEGWTNLFIMPGYRFQIADALITNFHLPRSTLLALTCAFGGYERIMDSYRVAVKKNYRFYSYGDATLIL